MSAVLSKKPVNLCQRRDARKRITVLPLDQLRGLPVVPESASFMGELIGVYFLWWQSRLLYIGRSIDIHRRVRTHRDTKDFTHATCLELPELWVKRHEQEYVLHYSPPLNLTRLG